MSKTIRTLDNEKDDRWRRKGVVHTGKEFEPNVCPVCGGVGTLIDYPSGKEVDCPHCEGTGEVYG